jgi:hypothetical protein
VDISYPQRIAIVKVYMQYPEAADPIIQDPELSERFCKDVNLELDAAERFAIPQLNRVLHNLRKLGEARGGLPRKQRQYRGRNARDN